MGSTPLIEVSCQLDDESRGDREKRRGGVTGRPAWVYNYVGRLQSSSTKRGVPVKPWLAALAIVLGIGPALRAEPLDRQQVSADAKWLAHIDFDAARTSKLAQKVYEALTSGDAARPLTPHEALLSRRSAEQTLEQIRRVFGIDLAKDLHGITFYGTRLVPESGVVIVRAELDRERLLGHVNRAPGHRTNSYGKHTLHSWTQAKGKEDEHTVTGCFHRPTVVVLGRDSEEIQAALDVLDGKSADLAGSDSALDADVPAGTMFEARVIELAAAKLPFKSPIVHQTEFLAIVLGEHNGEVFAQAKLVAKSAELAEQVRVAMEGLRALAELQGRANANALKILRAEGNGGPTDGHRPMADARRRPVEADR